ncbi:MAG TPA: hypothetical protein VIT41_11540 [Microlunatus sp.]
MSRRVKLPGASELFRPTGTETTAPATRAPDRADRDDREPERAAGGQPPGQGDGAGSSVVAGGTGRVRHEEKITVYVSRDELLAIEQARLRLRGELGLAVDRGRLVRAAMALALADLDVAGADGELVRRLTAP